LYEYNKRIEATDAKRVGTMLSFNATGYSCRHTAVNGDVKMASSRRSYTERLERLQLLSLEETGSDLIEVFKMVRGLY